MADKEQERGDDDYDWLYDPDAQPRPTADSPDDTQELPRLEDTQLNRHGHSRRKWLIGTAAVVAAAALVTGGLEYFNHKAPTGPAALQPAKQSMAPAVTLSPKPPTQAECIAKLPLDLKLGQLMMPSADASSIAHISAVAAKYNIGGVILMGPVPTAATTKAFVAAQSIAPLVATDQEGGTVERYKTGGTLPSAASVPSLWSVATAQQKVEDSDKYLLSQGINMNLAPLADVAPTGGSSVLGSRIFSSDANVVAEYAGAYVNAGLAVGVLPTLKHFPGLGDATQNTDYGPATSAQNTAPYRQLAGTKAAVMVGNQKVPDLTGGLPASLSKAAINDLLRGELGYKNNVVITDSLSAKAVTSDYTITQAAVKTWEAGGDIALFVGTDPGLSVQQQVVRILAAAKVAIDSGQLSRSQVNASVARIWALPQKHVDACSLSAAHN